MASLARIADLLSQRPVGERVLVNGWVRTRRDSKAGFSFVELNDGSCLANLQILAETTLPNYKDEIARLSPGACIAVEGTVAESPGKGQAIELRAESVLVHGFSDPSFPLQKKHHTFEYLRTIAHLRPRTNSFGAVFRVRSMLAQNVHEYFREKGFYYIHAPIITGSDAEGAGQMFQVTALDVGNPPRAEGGGVDYAEDFFGQKTHLTVSGQLEAEIFALALGKVYTFGPTFRAENSNTPRHLAEFWMIEPEMAFTDLDGNAEIAEDFLKSVVRMTLARCDADISFLDQRVQPGLKQNLELVASTPFERMTYTAAVALLEKSGQKFEYPVGWGLPHGLPEGHRRLLHAPQRRRQDGARDGRARPPDRRDHRRQPARGAPRRARREDHRARHAARGLRLVPGASQVRDRAAQRLRPGLRAARAVRDGHGEHSRRDPLPAHAEARGVLTRPARDVGRQTRQVLVSPTAILRAGKRFGGRRRRAMVRPPRS
jgi:asparaginyl-tRNA synthetase